MRSKITTEDIHRLAKKKGYKVLSGEYKNQKSKFSFECCSGHIYTTEARNLINGSSCPLCAGNRREEFPSIAAAFAAEGYTLVSKHRLTANAGLWYTCPYGHENKTTWSSFKRGRRCPNCKKDIRLLGQCDIEAALTGYGFTPISAYTGYTAPLKVRCMNGHERIMSYSNIVRGSSCAVCVGRTLPLLGEVKESLEYAGYTLISTKFLKSTDKIKFKCDKLHVGEMLYSSFKCGHRCLACSGALKPTLAEVVTFLSTFKYTLLSDEYCNAHTKLDLVCDRGHYASMPLHALKQGKRCIECFKRETRSRAEREITSRYTDKGVEVVSNTRRVIVPYELDLYFPKQKVAVEYCGLYWHSEISGGKARNYHYMKRKLCEDLGIRLITVFEDEYMNLPEVVFSRIDNALGRGGRKVFARKCQVKEITKEIARRFLDSNHLQGSSPTKKSWGIYLQDELLGVITVGALSRNHVAKKLTLELKRLAFIPGIVVVGGASKLFSRVKGFAKRDGYSAIKSYCDMRWGNPKNPVYELLGFNLTSETKYTPHYLGPFNHTRRRRNQTLRKTPEERLTGKTEWELRQEQGYDRIWDCGHRTYSLQI